MTDKTLIGETGEARDEINAELVDLIRSNAHLIPDDVLKSERGRRNASKRTTRRGGRPRTGSYTVLTDAGQCERSQLLEAIAAAREMLQVPTLFRGVPVFGMVTLYRTKAAAKAQDGQPDAVITKRKSVL